METQLKTTQQVADRFMELAKQEKWFDLQDELFSEDVKSLEPSDSVYFKDSSGKSAVREKGENWVKRIEGAHHRFTTDPVVADRHFVVGRNVDITVQGHGRIRINELMLYEVRDGKIISEQFFY